MIHPKVLASGLPFEFSIPLPSEEWLNETERYVTNELARLEGILWDNLVREYHSRELAKMTARRYVGKLTEMLDGEANG